MQAAKSAKFLGLELLVIGYVHLLFLAIGQYNLDEGWLPPIRCCRR
jgi:hypothetical protein